MTHKSMQLPHLETFLVAAELCSFTETARAFGLTQAAVSQRVQVLERMLGKPLFSRDGGRVVLTDAGLKLHAAGQRILALHRQARAEITGNDMPVAGDVILAAGSMPGERLLPGLAKRFAARHPHVRIRATVTDSLAAMAQVERGAASLGLVGRPPSSPRLGCRQIADDYVVAVVPADHELARRRRLSLQTLIRQPLIMREAASGLRHCFEVALERTGKTLDDFHVALELGSNQAIKEAVLQGAGVAILSIGVVQKEVETGAMHALRFSDLECRRAIYVVWDRRRALPLPARLFLGHLEAQPLDFSNP